MTHLSSFIRASPQTKEEAKEVDEKREEIHLTLTTLDSLLSRFQSNLLYSKTTSGTAIANKTWILAFTVLLPALMTVCTLLESLLGDQYYSGWGGGNL